MIYEKELDFARDIKDAPLRRLYLLYGSEEYLKELYLKMMIQRATGGVFTDFNVHRLSAENGIDSEELISAVQAAPFMCERSCAVLDNLNPDKLGAGDLEQLYGVMKDSPEECVFVLIVRTHDFDARRSAKAKALVREADKHGAVVELGKRSPADLVKFMRSYLKKSGTQLEPELARLLIEYCGSDMLTLKNEMDKLAAYSGYDKITRGHIDEAASQTVNARVFELSRVILEGGYESAMSMLGDLLYLKEAPVAIIGALSANYIDLYRAKAAQAQAKPESELLRLFDYKGREFRARNAMRTANKYSVEFLERSIGILARADMMLKTGRTEDTVVLQQTLTQLYRERQRERK